MCVLYRLSDGWCAAGGVISHGRLSSARPGGRNGPDITRQFIDDILGSLRGAIDWIATPFSFSETAVKLFAFWTLPDNLRIIVAHLIEIYASLAVAKALQKRAVTVMQNRGGAAVDD